MRLNAALAARPTATPRIATQNCTGENHLENIGERRADGEAHGDLRRALRHDVRGRAGDAEHREEHRAQRESAKQPCVEAPLRRRARDALVEEMDALHRERRIDGVDLLHDPGAERAGLGAPNEQ